MITQAGRRAAIVAGMREDGLEAVVLAGNGLHLIDHANPVVHATGFQALGEAVAVLRADGACILLLGGADEQARAAQTIEECLCVGTEDLAASLAAFGFPADRLAWVGLDAMPTRLADGLARAAGSARGWDARFDHLSAAKTAAELDAARRATAIAEAGYQDLLTIARDGVRAGNLRECDLAVELNLRMKALGADASFLMLNCLPRAPAVMPSSERVLQAGDMILVELSPSVEGQFVQICRTAFVGEPPAALVADYALLTEALADGIAAVRPGVPVSAICDAIDARTAAAGYAAYSRPPHLRRRGHGLGCGSIWPGDVAFDNPLMLQEDMLFVVHPNQLLPNSGYMMCGEPVRVSADGHEVLSTGRAALAVVEL